MKQIRLGTAFILILVICFMGGCRTTVPVPIKLTPQEQTIIIAPGNQATTLKLKETHISIATEVVTSEYNARARAVALGADIAQHISTDYIENSQQTNYNAYYRPTTTTTSSTTTYRFWKKK
jgi:hypothetical protein